MAFPTGLAINLVTAIPVRDCATAVYAAPSFSAFGSDAILPRAAFEEMRVSRRLLLNSLTKGFES